MTTAIDLITRSMRIAGVIGKGETPDDDESADGLTGLNSMLDSFSIERLNCYYIVDETLTLVNGQATYTMGSGGDLNTTRPTKIVDTCFTRYANIDIPLTMLNEAGYSAIVAKTISSNVPYYIWPDYQYPLVRLTFYPVPTTSAAVAHIKSWKQLQQFASLTTALALPPGYEEMIAFNLAVRWASVEFGQAVTPQVEKAAIQSKANIKRINAVLPIMRTEAGLMNRMRNIGNIYSG